MPRGRKEIPGQMTLFDFCTEPSNYVVQANDLIGGKQALKVNSAKLIRAAIMQVVRDDTELKPYKVTIPELSKLLGVPSSNMYRDIDDITSDIISHPVFIKVETDRKKAWVKIPWVTRCEYHSDAGVVIKLNDELKPFLVNLREQYTQYVLEDILQMKSVYSIRIYELLNAKYMSKYLPKHPVEIELTVDQIRECCGCEDKYGSFSNFKARVLDTAVNEINDKTWYDLSYSYRKDGKSVVAIIFTMKSKY